MVDVFSNTSLVPYAILFCVSWFRIRLAFFLKEGASSTVAGRHPT